MQPLERVVRQSRAAAARSCYGGPTLQKLKYIAPNFVTTVSMMLGLASVVFSVRGEFQLAAWMITWGMLLDKLDGTAARLLDASSRFGNQLDSFADFVTFGIAPAALLFFRLQGTEPFQGSKAALLAIAAGVFILAQAARLARFNISEPPMGDRLFYGIPGTLMGGMLALAYLTWDKYQLSPKLLSAVPIYMIIGAVLMVSTLRLPKLKMRKNKAFNIFQIGNIVACYICAPLRILPEYLFGLALVYIVVGVAYYLLYPPKEQTDSAEKDGSSPANGTVNVALGRSSARNEQE